MSNLTEAIRAFPILRWSSEHFKVYDSGNRNATADCPFCRGKKRMGIDRDKKIFHCFRCEEGGHCQDIWTGACGPVKMIQLVEHVTRFEAIKRVYELSGFPDPPRTEKELPRCLIPSEAIPLTRADPNFAANMYLKNRGVGHLILSSYVCLDGQYGSRIILEARLFGELVGFEAKSFIGKTPKSLYPEWFMVSCNFYTSQNWDFVQPFAVITESIVDAETLGCNAIGIFGSHLRMLQLPLLVDLKARGITRLVWMMDADAWKKQVKSIFTKALFLFDNYVVILKRDEDPNSIGRNECWARVASAPPVRSEFDLARLTLEFDKTLVRR